MIAFVQTSILDQTQSLLEAIEADLNDAIMVYSS